MLYNLEAINLFQSSTADAEVLRQSFLLKESYPAEMSALLGWVFTGYPYTNEVMVREQYLQWVDCD